MSEKVLFIDDDANLLAGFRRSLRNSFDVTTAEGGQEGLELIRQGQKFAVIVVDMRMPGMDGLQVLVEVQKLAPESVRIMLTGNADLETAVNAVNEGHVFRYLNKPCSRERMEKTLQAAVEQHRLITAEKQLLEDTLSGSVNMLLDLLSLSHPRLFGRAGRIKRYVRQMAEKLGREEIWQFELAAMLSQVGCLALPPETLDRILVGEELTDQEQAEYAKHADIGGRLVANIPRLWDVGQMIANQMEPFSWSPSDAEPSERDAVILGGHLLKIAADFDLLLSQGFEPQEARQHLQDAMDEYDPDLVEVLGALKLAGGSSVRRSMPVRDLEPGMVIDADVRGANGFLIIARGQELTNTSIRHLEKWRDGKGLPEPIQVFVPVTEPEVAARV